MPPSFTNLRPIRNKGGTVSYQADFRAYRDVGGRRLILMNPQSGRPIRCPDQARALYEEQVARLDSVRQNLEHVELPYDPRLGPMAKRHLDCLALLTNRAASTIDLYGQELMRLVQYFDNARLSQITGPRLEAYIAQRLRQPGSRFETTVSVWTVRREVMALSGLYKRALKWQLCAQNPVDYLTDTPWSMRADESDWLPGDEPARLLDAAARLDAETERAARQVARYRDERENGASTCALPPEWFAQSRCFPHCEAVIATLLYTGGRIGEVLGLTVEDVSFEHKYIEFRPNEFRNLKKRHHRRKVPAWRPLRETLRHHVERTQISSGLLFRGADGKPIKSFAKQFRRCLREASLLGPKRRLTPHSLRHTYATRMLCTLVRSETGSWTERSVRSVARLLGHRTEVLVERVYAHDAQGEPRRKRLSYEEARKRPAQRLRKKERKQHVAVA